ncbi:cation:proton antiporter [Hirschia baltica]|uniref:Sodium/hydrogen exchanger n=1 Tax=Hirschia baltica (strain ATCC 49814 / DSM 5838 / IFAM 1418) TaxID=582402 RepID=C6XRT8_HIRBI|nr:sodium:proton antiporter [Hirschia baltica]ACT60698.1 sodium/hydrogen exchanger [Hirschia baltica ATCC 49814]
MHDNLILAVAIIGVLGIGAQWLAWRLQAPAIVLMSVAGLFVGPFWAWIFGEPLLNPSQVFASGGEGAHGEKTSSLLGPIVSLAVAVILFEGGLNLRFHELREAGRAVMRLVFIGTPIAWGLGTLAAHYAAGLSWPVAILFAGILVVTGPTVIMPLLRQSKLGGKVGSTLKWEGIVNDPVGALLAVIVYEALRVLSAGENPLYAAGWIFFTAVIAGALGVAFGYGLVHAFRRGWTPEYLKAPILLSAVIACYSFAELIEHETGLVAVTVFGMAMANAKFASLQEVRRFKENIAVLLISGVFVILTANLKPEDIASAFNFPTFAFLFCMLFIVRPISAGLTTLGALEPKESALIGWIAPRGIVAVAISGFFAERMVAAGYPDAERLTTLAFAMAITTVVLHGFTIKPIASWLGLIRTKRPGTLIVGSTPWSVGFAKCLGEAGADVILADSNYGRLRGARQANLDRYYGEVISEEAELQLDHSKFDSVVAVSAIDPYNALVCSHFGPELGRNHAFQLATQDIEDDNPRAINLSARGQILGGKGRTYDALIRDTYRGWTFTKTTLTEGFTLENLKARRPEADLLAELRTDGSLVFLGPDRSAKGGAGVTIISFGPERTVEETEKKSEPEEQSKESDGDAVLDGSKAQSKKRSLLGKVKNQISPNDGPAV